MPATDPEPEPPALARGRGVVARELMPETGLACACPREKTLPPPGERGARRVEVDARAEAEVDAWCWWCQGEEDMLGLRGDRKSEWCAMLPEPPRCELRPVCAPPPPHWPLEWEEKLAEGSIMPGTLRSMPPPP
jgi:hypothetical protein